MQNGETIAPWDGTTVRLSSGHSLLNPVIRDATTAAPTAALGVFCRLQVADFDYFLGFFLCHFIRLSRWFGLP